MVATPHLTVFFSRSLQNAKERDLGHMGSLFYILCGHFDEINRGTTLPGSRVSLQSQNVRGWLQHFSFFLNILSRHFWKISAYYEAETLRNMFELSFCFCISKKCEISIFRTFFTKNLNFQVPLCFMTQNCVQLRKSREDVATIPTPLG